MYRQQSLITLDQLYEIKPLTKLLLITRFLKKYSLTIPTKEVQRVIQKSYCLIL